MSLNLTLVSEIASFLFFIWVFHRYVWSILINLLEKRQIEVEKKLQQAEEASKKLYACKKDCQKMLEDAQKKASEIIKNAELQCKNISIDQEKETKKKCQLLLFQAQEKINQEKESMEKSLKKYIADFVAEGMQSSLKERARNDEEHEKWKNFFITQNPKP